jgi:hypothetical protein
MMFRYVLSLQNCPTPSLADSGSLDRDYSLFSLLSPPPKTVTVPIVMAEAWLKWRHAAIDRFGLIKARSFLRVAVGCFGAIAEHIVPARGSPRDEAPKTVLVLSVWSVTFPNYLTLLNILSIL